MTSHSQENGSPVASDPRRWKALSVIALIQFMLILDVTVVNVALPHIQNDLGFSRSGLAWVVDGYVLMAGGLLLLGGRLADIFGRRRLFLYGIGVFAVASAACGAAANPAMLVISRFAQGTGEALAAPASLGLIAVLFPDTKERVKALGIYGGVAGIGGTTGTVLSGIIVNFASWRWIFFINLPVALFALYVVPRLVSESKMVREHERPDFAGAIAGTCGLIAVVDGLLAASTHAWGSWNVLVPLLGGFALLAATAFIELHSKAPLIPPSFFKNRTRVVTNFVSLFFSSAFFSYFFLLTLFMQQVLHYSALKGGLAYVPFGVSIGAGIGLGTALMPKMGVRPLLTLGFFGAGVGLFVTSQIDINASYATNILPGMVILGFFSGIAFPTTTNASLHEVTGQDSSLASGVQTAMQQVGGAIGLSCLVTLGIRHAASQIKTGTFAPVALINGYTMAFRIGSILLVTGSVLVMLLLEKNILATPRNAEAEAVEEPTALSPA